MKELMQMFDEDYITQNNCKKQGEHYKQLYVIQKFLKLSTFIQMFIQHRHFVKLAPSLAHVERTVLHTGTSD